MWTTTKVDWEVWETIRPEFRKVLIDRAIFESPQISKPVVVLNPKDLWMEIRVIPGR